MTVAEYNRQLEQFKNKLNVALFKKTAAYAGSTIRGEVENRVEQKQTNSKERLFSIYSPNYLKYRAKKGYHNRHKSFELTRRMWTEWNVIDQQIYNDGFMVRMGGSTEYSQDLINKHSEREGIAIIDLTTKEQQELNEWVDKWIIEEIKKAKL